MYQVVTVAHVMPEKMNAICEVAKGIIAYTRASEGNLSYDFVIPADSDDTVIIMERWESKESFLKHVDEVHEQTDGPISEFGAVFDPALKGEFAVYEGEPLAI